MDTAAPDDRLPLLERAQRVHDATVRQQEESRVRYEQMKAEQARTHTQVAELAARLDTTQQALHAERPLPPPLDPAHYETTIAQARDMIERETHPSWVHAAYADLAGRLARVEALLEDLSGNMTMIIGQLTAIERQDRPE